MHYEQVYCITNGYRDDDGVPDVLCAHWIIDKPLTVPAIGMFSHVFRGCSHGKARCVVPASIVVVFPEKGGGEKTLASHLYLFSR